MLVVFQYIMNEDFLIGFLMIAKHQEEIDFHQAIFVDHLKQLFVEYEEGLVVMHHNEILSDELVRLLTK
jgi:hypothetical protein